MGDQRSKLFSESWFKVSTYTVRLRPDIEIHKQRYRGERWYVLQDPYNNRFFRIRAGAYVFVSRLRSGVTVEEVWKECIEMDPDGAPGQEEVISLIGQLYQNNLIYSNLPPDSEKLFERIKKREEKELQGKLKSFLTPKFTLFDPDKLLLFCVPFFKFLFSKWGLLLWLGVCLMGLKTALGHVDELTSQAAGILAPDNLLPIILVAGLVKAIHEFGHGITCRVLGGQVHKCGVILLMFTLIPVPLPFVDTTSSYSFRLKRHRLLVAAGGMLFEFFCAACACMLWAAIGEGMGKSMLYNFMTVTTIQTVIFNINPFLKFDGYYILSDTLDVPNLQERAQKQLIFLTERFIFRLSHCISPAATATEGWILSLFGVLSFMYRIFLIFVIVNLVAGSWFGIGYFIAAVLMTVWVFVPLYSGLNYLANSPRLFRKRGQAWAITGSVVAALVILTMVIPAPKSFKAPGVVIAEDRLEIYTEIDGYISDQLVSSGSWVEKGQVLLQMENLDLAQEVTAQRAEINRLILQREKAKKVQYALLPSLNRKIKAADKRLQYLEEQMESCQVKAPRDGVWVSLDPDHAEGRLLVRGMKLGEVILTDEYYFSAVVSQENASHLFADRIENSEVMLRGHAGKKFDVNNLQLIPAEQNKLPNAALGWKVGSKIFMDFKVRGDIEIDHTESDPEKQAIKAKESFYLINAYLNKDIHDILKHQRTGYLRCNLPWEPVFWQAMRWGRQFLQKKHKI